MVEMVRGEITGTHAASDRKEWRSSTWNLSCNPTGNARPLRKGIATDTDRKINPGPPAQRFMKPPLSRYIALAQPRTMVLMSRRGPLLERPTWQSMRLARLGQQMGSTRRAPRL